MEPAAPRRARPSAQTRAAERDRAAAGDRARQHAQAAERARSRQAARDRTGPEQARRDRVGSELPPDRFLEREDSRLRFSLRVLEMAEDPHVPVLERVRFASIFADGMDEWFSVRIAGRIRRMATGLPVESTSGRSPTKVLEDSLQFARELLDRHARCFTGQLLPELASEGIEILRWKDLSADEKDQLQQVFSDRIFPVLTPLAVDPAHPFPFISGMSLSLALVIADPKTGTTMFARVKVPPLLPRFLAVSHNRFVPIEDVIAAHLGELFVGLDIREHYAFRVTRITDMEIDEDVTEDLLKSLELELNRRRFEAAVRLEVEDSISEEVLDKLVTELGMDPRAVYRLPGPLDLSSLDQIANLDMPHLKYQTFVPAEGMLPKNASELFGKLAERDILVHHPYDSFNASVQRLLVTAAADPKVQAIKQTLYRTSGDSEIVDALIAAANAGKQVVVVVEIKARGDEQANIGWVRKLEQAGCHVVYGLLGLKTHSKAAIIVREEAGGALRRYCHVGTGNYHPKTARVYEDFGLLTADPDLAEDVTYLFNHLTGYSRKSEYRRLLVAPEGVRPGLLDRISEQIAWHQTGRPALIQMKCNAIIDEQIIDTLYRASMAGVPVDLWIRGICALRPGVPGLSETIRVRSIVGRFLEHSRIYAFGTGEGDSAGEVWIGSADLMHRNLDRRVEALVRVTDERQSGLLRDLISLAMDSNVASWWLGPDGTYTRHQFGESGGRLADIQEMLIHARHGRAEA